MLLKTLLNKTHWLANFVYGKVSLINTGSEENPEEQIVAEIKPRLNSKPCCSGCGQIAPKYGYAEKSPRLFEHVPVWGIKVFFSYRMRRVNCRKCGVRVERVPWSSGKSPQTKALQWFLSDWAKLLDWSQVAEKFKVNWRQVYTAVKAAVDYGLKHRNLEGVEAIGVDEVAFQKGHQYMTLVYEITLGRRRLLSVSKGRSMKSFLRFWHDLGKERAKEIKYVCSDMWKPYLKVIAKKAPQALNILDRFHIVAHLNKAVDKVRIEEMKTLKKEKKGEILKNSKYCFLKNPCNLTSKQNAKLKDLLTYKLKSVRAYQLKESFQYFWDIEQPLWATWFLKKWCSRAMRSRLEPIKTFVKMIRNHQPLILNYFKAKKAFNSGVVEGLNRKVNLTTRKSYGFKSFDVLKIALFHTMGDLPEPKSTHRF